MRRIPAQPYRRFAIVLAAVCGHAEPLQGCRARRPKACFMVEPGALESFRFARDRAVATQPSQSRASVALDNLRGIVILIVLGFHSALAYVSWVAPSSAGFDSPPYNWRAFPIVDRDRFFGFDLFCAWQDVYLMSLMFFLSGLFVWPSLKRKNNWTFVRDRLLRLGIPYAFGIAAIIPVAIYPAYRVTAAEPGVIGYLHALLALPFWPNGPLWFLWQLLALSVIAGLVHAAAPNALQVLGRWSAAAATGIGGYFAALLAASALAYVPLAVAFTPWHWSDSGILALQFCRPLHYAVYFFAGVGVGVAGIDRGLVAVDGPLARRWSLWLGGALVALALWMGLTSLTLNGGASIGIAIAADLAYVLACATGCFFLIGVGLRFAAGRSRILGTLGASAYGLYLLHYVFVVWLQYALLAVPLPAIIKAAFVLGGTLVLTWITVNAVQKVPLGARLIGSARRSVELIATPTAPPP
jgi:glucans biosynthesis protein C